MRVCVCVRACVRARAHTCVHLCVCLCLCLGVRAFHVCVSLIIVKRETQTEKEPKQIIGKREREGERERERGGERGRERDRTCGLSQNLSFFPPLILFHVMGFVFRRRHGTEKNTLLLLSSLLFSLLLLLMRVTMKMPRKLSKPLPTMTLFTMLT